MIVLLFNAVAWVVVALANLVAWLFFVGMGLLPKPELAVEDEPAISAQALEILAYLGMTPDDAPPEILAQVTAQYPAGVTGVERVRSGRKA